MITFRCDMCGYEAKIKSHGWGKLCLVVLVNASEIRVSWRCPECGTIEHMTRRKEKDHADQVYQSERD